jgi:hypothetical protein
MSLREGKELV